MPEPSEARLRTQRLQLRAFNLAVGIVRACPSDRILSLPARELWRQLVRAALSTAGNLEEADEATSRADFIVRMKIALREVRETRLWLRVLAAGELTGHERTRAFRQEAGELSAIFATIIRNAKANTRRAGRTSETP
jgi:four helix bundle protein